MFRFQNMHQTDRKWRHQIRVSLWKFPVTLLQQETDQC